MKKIMMTAAMVMIAGSALAQDNLWKKASTLCDEGKLKEAVETITPCLTSDETKKKADAWNTMAKIQYAIFMKEYTTEVQNKTLQKNEPVDTATMNRSIVEAFKAALKCDEYDRQPNEKGKVKIKFRTENQKNYSACRPNLINSGLYEYNKGNQQKALEAWKLYIDSPKDSLFLGMDMSQDPYKAEIAYFAGLTAYNLKDYDEAVKYANIAMEDTAKAHDASEILVFSMKDQMKTRTDSLSYLNTIKELHAKYPDEAKYFNLLMEYYNVPGRQAEMDKWVKDEMNVNPNNKMLWALKGESEMNARKWDDAIESYKKAVELDPDFVQVVFNIGVCMNSKAIDLKDELADKKNGRLTVENANKVKAILAESKQYLEHARELDPGREKVNWAYPLYQIYYSLDDKENAAAMEKLLETK